jgi:hypothetical protein
VTLNPTRWFTKGFTVENFEIFCQKKVKGNFHLVRGLLDFYIEKLKEILALRATIRGNRAI